MTDSTNAPDTDRVVRTDGGTADSLETLLPAAEDALDSLEESLGDVDALDELEQLDDETLGSLSEDVETLVQVTTAVEDLLETIDLTDLPDAVDADELLASIEAGEVPDALADDDTDAGDLVDFKQVFQAIDLLDAWDATELGELWEAKRDLADATDEFTDGDDGDDADEEGGMISETVSTVTDDDEDDDDLLDDASDAVAADDADPSELLGDIDVMEDPEAYQVAIQQQAMKGIDAFREGLLETHAKFEKIHEFNREKLRRQDTSTSSRNPTAASTLPTGRRDVGGGVNHSTVPQQVRLSTAPSRKRIYGQRFEREREKRQNENENEDDDSD